VSDSLLLSSDKDAQIVSLKALLVERDAALAEARAELLHRDLLIETMRVQLARLRRMQFGASSEKLSQEIEQLELALEELEARAVEVTQTAPLAPKPERPVPVRSLPEHLPREDVVAEPSSGTCACPDCGGILRKLGDDSAEQLDVAPVRWRVVRTIRPKYSCRVCDKIVQASAPVKAIARGKATFATLAHVIVAKFDHHLPLYRQSEMMAAQGVDIDRSTLAGWTGQASALLDPIISRIREQGAKATKIHTDDSEENGRSGGSFVRRGVPVLDPGRGKTATGRLWTYVVDDRASGSATPPLAWYRFTPDRTGVHPQKELASFKGHLQADAYSGYDKLYQSGRVTEVACWAHFRRKIFDIHKPRPTTLTTDILERIAALYAIEAEVRGQPPGVRQKARHERTRPLIAELRKILDDAHRRLSPKSVMALAIAYGTKRWSALTHFLDNGSLEIDNSAHRLMPGASGDAQPLNARCAASLSDAKTLMTIVNVPRATKQTVPPKPALDGIAIGREQDARDFSTVAQTLVRGLVTP
jgi:transposase